MASACLENWVLRELPDPSSPQAYGVPVAVNLAHIHNILTFALKNKSLTDSGSPWEMCPLIFFYHIKMLSRSQSVEEKVGCCFHYRKNQPCFRKQLLLNFFPPPEGKAPNISNRKCVLHPSCCIHSCCREWM